MDMIYMDITYRCDTISPPAEIIALYESAGLLRPVHDPERIAKMYAHSNLVMTAWDGARLVAMDYYPKQGFEKVENGFIIKRKN